MQTRREILLYGGEGASFMALWQLFKGLRLDVDLVRHPIRKVTAAEIREGALETAALFILSSPMNGEEEVRRIRSFVEKGGSYLGIGRGASFLFPGKSSPLFGTTAPIRVGKESFPVVVDGGCLFLGKGGDVIASYHDMDGSPSAIVSCKCGKGRAILSGAHVEYSAHLMERLLTPDEARLGAKLVPHEIERRKLFRTLLSQLGITLARDKRQDLF